MSQQHPKVSGHGAESMKLVAYAVIPKGKRIVHQGMSLAGNGPREICGLAFCQDSDGSVYLFTCDSSWTVMFDTNHGSLDEAKKQADFEYPGLFDL